LGFGGRCRPRIRGSVKDPKAQAQLQAAAVASSKSITVGSLVIMLKLALAGVLAVPALLLTLVMVPVLAILSIPSAALLLFRKKTKASTTDEPIHRHIIITGGSSGIGLAIAQQAAAAGHAVTILARSEAKLKAAQESSSHKIHVFSVDVTSYDALQKVASRVFAVPATRVHLFVCAGEAFPAHFKDLTALQFQSQVNLNQLGATYTCQAFMPYLEKTESTITFCASMCGQIGVFGYAAYAPTKFALRGLAECLAMETSCKIQIAYPPDTNTPGFETENKTKPQECVLISEAGGLSEPGDIAKRMLVEALCQNPRFHVYFNLDGFILANLCTGFSPVTTLSDAVAQLSAITFFRWVALFYVSNWVRIIENYQGTTKKAWKDGELAESKDDGSKPKRKGS
jgi:3-dehydrosphinganine reductase